MVQSFTWTWTTIRRFVLSLWLKANVIVPGKIDDLASRKGQVYARYTIEDGMLKRNGKVVVPNQNNLR